MTFMLRDRPDGQIEIVVNRPQVIGVFSDRGYATKVFLFLQEDDAFGQVDDAPAGFATASADVAEAEFGVMSEAAQRSLPAFLQPVAPPPTPQPRQERPGSAQLPALLEPPKRTALVAVEQPRHLTEDQLAQAFDRIAMGEKLAVVAPEFGVTVNHLRALWANHKRRLQKHLAEGGQISCALCTEPFTPSISSPDKCARCSHE